MAKNLTREQHWQVAAMLAEGKTTAEVAEATGVAVSGVRRLRRNARAVQRPMSPLAGRVEQARKVLDRAFDRFERSQTRATYDGWQDALREYDQWRLTEQTD